MVASVRSELAKEEEACHSRPASVLFGLGIGPASATVASVLTGLAKVASFRPRTGMSQVARTAWRSSREQVNETVPEEGTLETAEEFLFDKANLASPQAADGLRLEELELHPGYPAEFSVQAFVAQGTRSAEAVSMATKAAREASASFRGAAAPEASSARELANHLAPLKQTDTTKMLADARLSRLPSPVQLEQGLIDKLNQETVDAKILQRPPLRLRKRHRCYWCRQMVEKDLSVHCLRCGQFFHQHCFIQHLEGLIDKPNQETVDAKILQRPPLQYVDCTWSLLNGDEPEDSLASLGAALRNAAESQRFLIKCSMERSMVEVCAHCSLSVSAVLGFGNHSCRCDGTKCGNRAR